MTNLYVMSGGLFGYLSPLSGAGDAIIKDITIANTIVSGGYSNDLYGNGGLIATVNDFDLTIENVNVQADVTSIANSNAGGLIGTVIGASTLTIDGANIDQSNISISGSGSSLGAGGAIGLLQSTNHNLSNITVTETEVSSSSLSGGLIGYANQATGILDINQIDISDTTITSSISNATLGVGGLIGVNDGYSIDIDDAGVKADITASGDANVGGIIGVATSSSTLNLDNVSINGSNITITGTNTALGAGGFIGLLQSTNHTFTNIEVLNTDITSLSLSGGVIGYADTSSGTLTIEGVDVIGANITSSISGETTGVGGVIAAANGYQIDMSDGFISSNISATSGSNAGGIIGFVNDSVILDFENITVNSSTINVNVSDNSLGAGGVVGLLYGDGHQFTKIRLTDSTITSEANAGGMIGRTEQVGATTTFNNIRVVGSEIYSSLNNATSGSAGIVGRNRRMAFVMNDIYIESNISGFRTNVAGLIGFSRWGDLTVNRAVIYSNLILIDPANGADRGASAIIGRNRDGTASSINDVFFTGYFKARVVSNQPYVGVLKIIDTDLIFTNVRSAEITYFLPSDSNVLVNTIILYNNMRGQNPDFVTTYTTLRSSLDTTYWTTHYISITNSSLWVYNATTHLYQLID